MTAMEHLPFTMLNRGMHEEQDECDHYGSFSHAPSRAAPHAFPRFADPSNAFHYPELPNTMGGFEHNPYASHVPPPWSYGGAMSPPLFQEDREMGIASNLSTASAPSVPSSAVGSPQSTHGQPAPMPDWAHQRVLSPGIVGSHDYYAGTEYNFNPTVMDDYAPLTYTTDSLKPLGHVGELPRTPTASASDQQRPSSGSPSPYVSRRESSCTFSSESGFAMDTPPEPSYAPTRRSPMSPQSSRRPSIFASPDSSNPLSSPAAPVWTSPVNPLSPFFSQSSGNFIAPLGSSCWFPCLVLDHTARTAHNTDLTLIDPSLIHPDIIPPLQSPYEPGFQQMTSAYPSSPALTSASPHVRNGSQSPFLPANGNYHYSPFQVPVDQDRRPSLVSFHSGHSGAYSDSDSKEKQRCPHRDCGKVFKDLKAHMLTHQTERPEKCPIATCEYHLKGFARKYDKNRHTLTHYKGTMVCGFCPGSGSAAEKSFNRADVFKRHLTAVHAVEQTPPNSRKNKNGSGSAPAGTGKKPGPDYAPGATGVCSTCSQTFSNAQDFYEHLDDCVLRIVQQEDPAEAVNARRLAEVENDREVHATLEKNNLPTTTTQTMDASEDDEDEEMFGETFEDEEGMPYHERELKMMGVKTSASPTKKKGNPANGVQKSKGLTHSRGGVSFSRSNASNKGRKNRKEYPASWGYPKDQMTMRKRVVAVFDGPRRLAKDDMMLSTEHEVRLPLSDGKSYITDLDVQTLKRAEGFLGATDEEKGPWLSDDPTPEEYQKALAQLQ